ncbi:MAG: DUF5674 family protein [Candidatus Caenarcaniphilales bacterium]|jgi:hypothetical protein|nr:DUF5674 family protein [Candidatus Caenarcaniphilales bacterium]
MYQIEIITNEISLQQIIISAKQSHITFTKAVVDIEKGIMAIGSELHVDEEQTLIDQGSKQENLWGINIHIKSDSYEIEFDSMINLRPNQNNYSRAVEDSGTQKLIIDTVEGLIDCQK